MRNHSAALLRDLETLFQVGGAAGLTDAELLERVLSRRGGDVEAAFRAIVARHGPMVWGVCRRHLADMHETEDAFQATFLILVRKAPTIRLEGSLGPWLYGVSCKVAARARVLAQRRRAVALTSEDVPAPRIFDAEALELRGVLDEELARLPASFRAAIVLCDLEGLTHEEAARRLRCPPGTIKSRLNRGRARLKTRLTRRGIDATSMLPGILPIVPQGLFDTTVRAVLAAATSPSTVLPLTSATTLVLTQGVIRSMLVSKLKIAAVAITTFGGIGVVGEQRFHQRARAADGQSALVLMAGDGLKKEADGPKDVVVSVAKPADSKAEGSGAESSSDLKTRDSVSPNILSVVDGTVRITVLQETERQKLTESGVAVVDEPGKTILLTRLRLFRFLKGQVAPDRCLVTRFRKGATGEPVASPDFPGEFVDGDTENDLALVRVNGMASIPVAPLVPDTWTPEVGQMMVISGLDKSLVPFAKLSLIIIPNGPIMAQPKGRQEIILPDNRWSAHDGPMFTQDGRLAGFRGFFGPYPKLEAIGFTKPAAIRRLLERNGIKPAIDKVATFGPSTPPGVARLLSDPIPNKIRTGPVNVATIFDTSAYITLLRGEGKKAYKNLGTVIKSDANEAYVLTSLHPFEIPKGVKASERLILTTEVNDGEQGADPSRGIEGEFVDTDEANDLALVRFHPGRPITAAPLVPPGWKPRLGVTMVALGSGIRRYPSSILTRVHRISPNDKNGNNLKPQMVQFDHDSLMSNGPLFTLNSALAGFRGSDTTSDISKSVGTINPEAMHRLLERNGIKPLVANTETQAERPNQIVSYPSAEEWRRLADRRIRRYTSAIENRSLTTSPKPSDPTAKPVEPPVDTTRVAPPRPSDVPARPAEAPVDTTSPTVDFRQVTREPGGLTQMGSTSQPTNPGARKALDALVFVTVFRGEKRKQVSVPGVVVKGDADDALVVAHLPVSTRLLAGEKSEPIIIQRFERGANGEAKLPATCYGTFVGNDDRNDLRLIQFRPGVPIATAAVLDEATTLVTGQAMLVLGWQDLSPFAMPTQLAIPSLSVQGDENTPATRQEIVVTRPQTAQHELALFTTDRRLAGITSPSAGVPKDNFIGFTSAAVIRQMLANYGVKAAAKPVTAPVEKAEAPVVQPKPTEPSQLSETTPDLPVSATALRAEDAEAVMLSFYGEPRVYSLVEEIHLKETALASQMNRVRSDKDPSLIRLKKEISALKEQKSVLWRALKPRLVEQVLDPRKRIPSYSNLPSNAPAELYPVNSSESSRLDRLEKKLDQLLEQLSTKK